MNNHCLRFENVSSMVIDDLKFNEDIGRGDNLTFKDIYDRYHPILYTLALNMLHDRESARDIVHNVFLKFWMNRRVMTTLTDANLLNYLYTMTKNSVLNVIKRKKIELKVYSEKKMTDKTFEDSIYEKMIGYEKHRMVEDAILLLSPIKQTIVSLKREGFTNAEIAQKLSLSVNTVKAHYAVALNKLKDTLKYVTIFILYMII